MANFKYIYGPVPSWRLGSSLGVDLISTKEKFCTFDCIYCQLGKSIDFLNERKTFVSTNEVIKEIKSLPGTLSIEIDYITFSGRGEPTLAKNLGEVISIIRTIRNEKIAVLTNSSLMDRRDVREDLSKADFVIAKLDAYSQKSFESINRPMPGIKFDSILKSIKQFRSEYSNRLALQIMFVEENKDKAEELACIAREIAPDEVEINTPLRPSRGVRPLSREELLGIKEYFKAPNAVWGHPVCVYDIPCKKEVSPISCEDTLRRRQP